MGRDLHAVEDVGLWISVSIHAPTWGATSSIILFRSSVKFQSTRPRGARPNQQSEHNQQYQSFNPRAHVGRDPNFGTMCYWDTKFQSTRPRGARRSTFEHSRVNTTSFNPRAHVGRDAHQRVACDVVMWVSIHAPTWGATQCRLIRGLAGLKFQSTRPRGARPTATRATSSNEVGFNPRAHVGRD